MNTYTRKKKQFVKAMASVSLLPITMNERRRMAKKGVVPQGLWNIHHILPRCQGGKDTLDNFSLIRIPDHEKLTAELNHILESCDGFTEEDFPHLKTFAQSHGAFTLDMKGA